MKKFASKQGSELILKDSGGYTFKMSKAEWKKVGKQAGWNHLDERTYQDYGAWRRACKAVDPNVVFEGDRDICQALGVGEWDGYEGSVYNDASRGDARSDPMHPDNTPSLGDKFPRNIFNER